MKDDHRARRPVRPDEGGESKAGRIRADGIIDSDSEDEKVVQAAKRKSPAKDAADQVVPEIDTKPAPTEPTKIERKTAPPPAKRAKTAA